MKTIKQLAALAEKAKQETAQSFVLHGIPTSMQDRKKLIAACNPETILAIAKQQEELVRLVTRYRSLFNLADYPKYKDLDEQAKDILAQYEQDTTHKVHEEGDD